MYVWCGISVQVLELLDSNCRVLWIVCCPMTICCRRNTDEDAKNTCSCFWFCAEKKKSGGPSNLTLLSTAFVSFLIFTAAQLCAALVANSQSMLADTGAMSVDICSYALNWLAERKKCNVSQKRQQLLLELIAPSFSVIALLGITIYSLHGSIITLTPGHAAILPSDQPNLLIMLVFSSINLALDILNVSCFARAKKLFGFKVSPMTVAVDNTLPSQRNESIRPSSTDDFVEDGTESICEKGMIPPGDHKDPSTAGKRQVSEPEKSALVEHDVVEKDLGRNPQSNSIVDKSILKDAESHTKGCCTLVDDTIEHSVAPISSEFTPNLNMCSAYTVRKLTTNNKERLLLFLPHIVLSFRTGRDTVSHFLFFVSPHHANCYVTMACPRFNIFLFSKHISADTLRSIAVLLASFIALSNSTIHPDRADAVATVVVSLLIILSILPLMRGLFLTWRELQHLQQQSKVEEVS